MDGGPDPSLEVCRIRPIESGDDAAIAQVIREVMTEHGASGAGFAIHDAEVAAMSAAYARPGAAYFVVARDGTALGGGGIAPLEGGTAGVCELKKMYFLPAIRGRGLGAAVLTRCLEFAREAGYATCYLETLRTMGKARALYEAFGFRRLGAPLGATGHFGCDSWYALDL